TDAIKYYLSSIDAFVKNNDKESLQTVTERITKLSPDNIPLRVKLAEYFQKEGYTENTAKEYVSIGQICEKKGEIDKAKEFYEKAVEIYPRYEKIYDIVTDFYKSLQLYDDAIKLLEKGLELYPEKTELKLKKAEILLMKGSIADAKAILNDIIASNPEKETLTQSTRLLVDAYLAEDKKDLAWENLTSILLELFNLEGKSTVMKLVDRFRDSHGKEVSERLIEIFKALEDSEGLFQEYVRYGDYLKQEGDLNGALQKYKEAQKIRQDDDELNQRIYQIELSLSQAQEVKVDEKKEKKSSDEKIVDADIFIRYGLYEEALDILEKLKVEEPENIEVHKRLKSIYLETNDKEQAVTECLILSRIYDKLGEYENKEQALKEAFDINPEDPRLIELTHKQEEPSQLYTSQETEFVGTTLPELEEEEFKEQAEPAFGFEQLEDTTSVETPPVEELTELIAEADFYYRQGLLNDALNVYERLLSIHPDREEFRERIEEIKNRLAPADKEAQTEESTALQEDESIKMETPLSEEPSQAVSFEPPTEPIQEETEEELITEELSAATEEEISAPEPELTSEVMEIFEEFKKGIADELEEEDYETHYNLGIAYKEMGLLDDAIKEFQIAKQDPERRVHVMSMLGVCYMEKQLYSLAIDAYKGALEGMEEKNESYYGTMFDLANAYEKNGDLKAALDIYVKVYGWDSKFREVDKRINNLKKMLSEDSGEAEIAEEEPPKRKDRISYI
ncbi:MAG: tetratricopeptide repeat protein, partial [Nitrospirae bacterium]